MPNDAKLGLVFGIGLVLVIGVVFFRKEPGPLPPTASVPAHNVSITPPHSMPVVEN